MGIFLLIKRMQVVFLTLFLATCIPIQNISVEQPKIFNDDYKLVETIELDWPYTWAQDIYLMNDTILVRASIRKPFQFIYQWIAYDLKTRQWIWSARAGSISSYPNIVYDEQKLYTDSWRLKAIDLKTGEIVWDDAINAASNISISENLLFVGDKYKILIYDKESGELVAKDDDIGFRPRTFYDPQRNWFVAISDKNISIYDGNSGTLIQNMNNINDETFKPICGSWQLVAYWDGKLFCENKNAELGKDFLQRKEYIGYWVSKVSDNMVFLLKEGNLVAYDLLEEKILWQRTFLKGGNDGQQAFIESKVVLFPPYGAVFTSDAYLHVFRLNDGEEISSTRMFSKRNIENKSTEYYPDFIAADEEYVVITLEDNKLSVYKR
ncbi:MAG: hypothetical protein CVU39_13205 [Chloroflexi bacterium HGW-Chloroflexi-10]|nr:MAG: hypothetical protein CVU39_13205 [Chloroflexi bacterium HGW-Chloroflexi-10]